MRPDGLMGKNRQGIIVCGLLFSALQAGAATPHVAAEYDLRVARAPETYAATAASGAGGALAVFTWGAFEGEPYAGNVAVMGGDKAPLELSGVWSAAFDAEWKRLAVGEQIEVVDNTVEPPFARTSLLCRELGMDATSLGTVLYYDGFAGNGYVTRPVIYELGSGKREALAIAGGDYVDWAGESRLVIGRETGGGKSPDVSALALYGYNVKNMVVTYLAGPAEAVEKLGEKLSADVRDSPYLSASWRRAPSPGDKASLSELRVAVPARGGAFENGGAGFYWRPDGGEAAFVAKGAAVAASGDGTWLVAYGGDGGEAALTAYRLAWR
jgi:hypothetical protein